MIQNLFTTLKPILRTNRNILSNNLLKNVTLKYNLFGLIEVSGSWVFVGPSLATFHYETSRSKMLELNFIKANHSHMQPAHLFQCFADDMKGV